MHPFSSISARSSIGKTRRLSSLLSLGAHRGQRTAVAQRVHGSLTSHLLSNIRSFSSSSHSKKEGGSHRNEPEYILPTANRSLVSLYVLISLILGTIGGFILHSFEKNIREVLHMSEEENEEVQENDEPILKQFERFADVERDGEKLMTIETFLKFLIGDREGELPSWIAFPRSKGGELLLTKNKKESPFVELIQFADLDGDNLISKNEFLFFHTLLFSDPKVLNLAFYLFDTSGNGRIDFKEFSKIIQAISKSEVNLSNNGLVKRLFGNRLNQELTFEEFHRFIQSMKRELLKLEFAQRDVDGSGLISVEDFSDLITKSKHFNSFKVPFFKRQLNILKTKGYFRPTGRISFSTFEAFRQMCDSIDEIEASIQLLQAANQPVNREIFSRALKQLGDRVSIPDHAINLIFTIFDDDGDGNINEEEFLKVFGSMKAANEENDA